MPSLLDPDPEPAPGDDERSEPDLLLLVDALERSDPDALDALETSELINLYTLLSDVQRDANDLRKVVSDLLLSRLHHDQAVSAPSPQGSARDSAERTASRSASQRRPARTTLAPTKPATIERRCTRRIHLRDPLASGFRPRANADRSRKRVPGRCGSYR